MVLIAANGDGQRWNGPEPKVLAKADGEPLVCRTQRLCRERDIEPVVLSHRPDVLAATAGTEVPGTDCVCATLLLAPWEGRGVVLLGDVWYATATLAAALYYRGACVQAWGTHQEVFAVAWDEALSGRVRQAMAGAVPAGGKLWHALRHLDGLPLRSHHVLPSMLTLVADGTRDFDHWADLVEWRRGR